MRLHWVRVVVAAFMAAAVFSGCGPDATELTSCESVDFKKRLCGVSTFPDDLDSQCDGSVGEVSEPIECQLKCWFDAPCDDVITGDRREARPDVQECLADCGAQEVDSQGGDGFSCGDGTTIPTQFVCDDTADCRDGSDEDGCSGSSLGGRFYCDDGADIPESWRCDESVDCPDGSDEDGC